MKLQDQVCTLEQAKRLRELGLWNNSLLKWVLRTEPRVFWNAEMLGSEAESWQKPQDELPAFTVAELGVMLPDGFLSMQMRKPNPTKGWMDARGVFCWDVDEVCVWSDVQSFPTEAQARAAMLIHLLETGATTAAEVNARLND